MVKVRFFTILREVTGTRELDLSLPSPVKIKDVLDHLVSKFPDLVPLLFEDGSRTAIKGYYQLVINGQALREAEEPAMMDHVLDDRDVIAILPPVGGGS